MNLTDIHISEINSLLIGNVMRKEGIDSSQSKVECSNEVKKRLSALCLELVEKASPYMLRDSEGYSPFISTAKALAESPGNLQQKALDLATRLYESGEHLQIPTTTFVTMLCDVELGDGELVSGLMLLGFSSTEGQVSYEFSSSGHNFGYVDVLNEKVIDRFVIWYEGMEHLLAMDKKSIANKYWLEEFLGLKPVLTEKKATGVATQLIKKVSGKIKDEEDLSAYKQAMKDLLAESDEICFDDIKECSKSFVEEDTFESVKHGLEKQSNLSLEGKFVLPTSQLDKKVNQFVKTLKLTPKLDVTLKGAQEIVSMEKVASNEEDTILIKLRLKSTEDAPKTKQTAQAKPMSPVSSSDPLEDDDDREEERGFDDGGDDDSYPMN